MAVIANAAYFGTTGKLEMGATAATTDEFTSAVTSCALVPNAPVAQVADIGGGVASFVGANIWVAQITFNQDWKTANSLSQKLLTLHGSTQYVKYTPDNGGKVATFQVIVQAAQMGGAASSLHTATVNLQVINQPTFA